MSGIHVEGASSTPYWLDTPDRPAPRPALVGDVDVDLLVIGGGFTGLWAALLALEEQPGADVVLLEGHRIGWAATGRNGGFCAASLTHGLANGVERWPDEMPLLTRLGQENLDAIEDAVRRYGIDCAFDRAGEARRRGRAVAARRAARGPRGRDVARPAAPAARRRADPRPRRLPDVPRWPLRPGRRRDPRPGPAGVGSGRRGRAAGGRLHEQTRVTGLLDLGDVVAVRTTSGTVRARRVVLGTNVFPSPVRRLRQYVVPVWDHVLVTEPLGADVLDALSWPRGYGIGDAGNQFHYYRRTADDRLLWGGYDALYYFGNDMSGRRARNARTERVLADHLLQTFPQARRRPHHPRLGRRHRHLLAVQRVLGDVARRAGGGGQRLHRARGGGHALRRPGLPRPAGRPRERADVAGDGAQQADPVPARAVPLGRHRA
ncbi:hypothetical protein GCM10025868_08170 [Angustibacter aerolatus]|uniref:FAD dependent oxidoreductase domain-containing protein n=1 Tax=Angustibacter aerolatus TaxID=1162965 RepID=A0ABQ6JCS6_9ACTN|nr:FAD-binding oxidoreductase [Angustibacter aerolatus]GMA85567.1 hypothetical protein GCM10025868_08170 [Angustibacter aerolatus]